MSETTIAEVADKAVDHIANGVQQIATAVEKLAHGAWEVAVRQQRVEGIVDAALGVVIIAAACICAKWVWRALADVDEIDRQVGRGFTVVGVTILTLFCTLNLVRHGILHASAPEYYAAMNLVEMVKK